LRVEIDILVADDDYVGGRWPASGTPRRPGGALEATGRRATFSAVNIFRFEDGKVAEIWNHRDDLGLQEQLGSPVFAGARPEA
ncbi:MAG: ester cyclase, partial [Solirubrobacteraceae bacterium]